MIYLKDPTDTISFQAEAAPNTPQQIMIISNRDSIERESQERSIPSSMDMIIGDLQSDLIIVFGSRRRRRRRKDSSTHLIALIRTMMIILKILV